MIASQSEKLVSSIRSQVTSSGYEVVGMASNGYDLIRRCKALAPAVVIVLGFTTPVVKTGKM